MVCGRRGCKGKNRKGKEGKGRERKGKDGKGRKKEGKGRERNGKEGKGWERMGKEGNRKGKERTGRERKRKEEKGTSGKRSRWRSASLAERTAADGVGARVAGNGRGGEAAGDERAWPRGRLPDGKWVRRTARTAANGVGATGWLEMGGGRKPLVMNELGCADGCGRRECKGVVGNGCGEEAAADGKWVRRIARTAADGLGAREWLEMGGEKKPLVMSQLGCADGCGRRGCKGVAGNGWGEEAAGDEPAWLRGRLRTVGAREWLEMGGEKKPLMMSELGCADGCGRRGCKGVVGNGWEKKPLEISELGCADGCGRPRCKGGWKRLGRRSRW